MKEKEYEISICSVKENIVSITASSLDEALRSAEDIALAPDYEKLNNTKNTKCYITGELKRNKPRFLKRNDRFVISKK